MLPSFWNKDEVKWYAANVDMDQCGISAKDYSGISLYSRYKLITPFRINVICQLDFLFNIYIMILTVYRLYLLLTLHNHFITCLFAEIMIKICMHLNFWMDISTKDLMFFIVSWCWQKNMFHISCLSFV